MQQDGLVARKVNISGFDSFTVCFSGISNKWDMYFRYVQIKALIFLENALILKVVVFLREAIRSGNGSFDRE